MKPSRPQTAVDTIRAVHQHLGFEAVDDEAFFQFALARLLEPTSKPDSVLMILDALPTIRLSDYPMTEAALW